MKTEKSQLIQGSIWSFVKISASLKVFGFWYAQFLLLALLGFDILQISLYLQSTITIRQCKNNDYDGLFSEYGLTYKILNNLSGLENQNQQRKNYLEFSQTSHIPKTDHDNPYFCTILQ